MTNTVTETLKVRMPLPEWQVRLRLYVRQYGQVWGNGCTRYFLTQQWMNFKVLAEERY